MKGKRTESPRRFTIVLNKNERVRLLEALEMASIIVETHPQQFESNLEWLRIRSDLAVIELLLRDFDWGKIETERNFIGRKKS